MEPALDDYILADSLHPPLIAAAPPQPPRRMIRRLIITAMAALAVGWDAPAPSAHRQRTVSAAAQKRIAQQDFSALGGEKVGKRSGKGGHWWTHNDLAPFLQSDKADRSANACRTLAEHLPNAELIPDPAPVEAWEAIPAPEPLRAEPVEPLTDGEWLAFNAAEQPALETRAPPQPPPTPASAVRAAAADVAKLTPDAARRTRYLWLGPGTAAEKQTLWQVLSAHINSLSREPDIVRPAVVLANGQVVDGLGLPEAVWGGAVLLRLVIDDYRWDAKVYEGLAEIDPYFHVVIEEGSPAGTEVVTETITETITVKKKVQWPGGIWQVKDGGDGRFYAAGEYLMDVPEKVQKKVEKKVEKKAKERVFAAAPWLADTPADAAAIALLTTATASQTPILLALDFLWQTGIQAERKVGYYDLSGIKDQKAFDKLVGFEKKESQRFKRELLAAVANSGVSHQPRRIARFSKQDGGYWSTFDNRLAQNTGNPLRVLNGGFTFDASEVFANGPNGIFKLALFDKDGNRQDSAPDLVGGDRTTASNDFRIHIGLSCWRCHQADKTSNGLNSIKDWARNLLKRPLALQSADYEKLKQLRQSYLKRLEPYMAADRLWHAEAIKESCGLTPFEWTQKFASVWAEYERPITRARAARELGVTEDVLVQALDRYVKGGGQPDTVITMFLRPAAEQEAIPLESWREEFASAQVILRSILR